ECALAGRPCVVGARGVTDSGSVDLLVVRVGSGEVVLREDRSDGTSLVTFARERHGGLQIGDGLAGHLRLGRRTLRAGGELDATVLGLAGSATTWELPDRAAAARLVERIVVDGPRDLGRRVLDRGRPAGGDAPVPVSTTTEVGVGIDLAGSVSRSTTRASLGLHAEDLAGAALEPATGRRTFL